MSMFEWSTRPRVAGTDPSTSSLASLLEWHVIQSPRSLAVVDRSWGLNFAGLNRRAPEVARQLQQLGVGPGDLGGVRMEDSPPCLINVGSLAGGRRRRCFSLGPTPKLTLETMGSGRRSYVWSQRRAFSIADRLRPGPVCGCNSGWEVPNQPLPVPAKQSPDDPKSVRVHTTSWMTDSTTRPKMSRVTRG